MNRDYKRTYQDRPARLQVTYAQTQKAEIVGGVYNNWYSKWQGEGKDFGKEVDQNQFRLIVEKDAGKTRANQMQPFCIHFAHGKCGRGSDCKFLHRIPVDSDQPQTTIDCFGRDKFRNNRDDMGGIGSFEKPVSTLYIGNIGINEHMEEIVKLHFGEWGEIVHVTVLQSKGVAFVQYKNLMNAEFAKEAMQGQTLESSEIVNVRWANEDPNPGGICDSLVREELKRKAEERVVAQVQSKLPKVGEKGSILDYESQYKKPKKTVKVEQNDLFLEDDQYDDQTYSNEAYAVKVAVEPVVQKKLVDYESSDEDQDIRISV